ncbi:MAG: hypothetical protein CMB80_14685 [Flammeovirgaceae bacterium]|nr:hypothetical protein [Flammeovirgaceae bacterium]
MYMSTKFIENNIEKLVQIYITETNQRHKQRGVLLLDFRKQGEGNVDVRYLELHEIPKDISEIVFEKMGNSLYDSVAFFCVLKPDNKCLLFDINLDKDRDRFFVLPKESPSQSQTIPEDT